VTIAQVPVNIVRRINQDSDDADTRDILIRRLADFVGLDAELVGAAGSATRPVGRLDFFLQDVETRGVSATHVLDVGAHKGDWSREVAKEFPNARFTLVEPQEEMRSPLDAFCSNFRSAQWICAAVGSEEGELTLTIWPDLAGSSLVPTAKESVGKQTRTVPIVTVDAILKEHDLPIPDIARFDIQGFELEALRGASALFAGTEIIILEVSMFASERKPGLATVIEFMNERDFQAYDFCGFLRRPLDGALGQADIAFARSGGALRNSKKWGD